MACNAPTVVCGLDSMKTISQVGVVIRKLLGESVYKLASVHDLKFVVVHDTMQGILVGKCDLMWNSLV